MTGRFLLSILAAAGIVFAGGLHGKVAGQPGQIIFRGVAPTTPAQAAAAPALSGDDWDVGEKGGGQPRQPGMVNQFQQVRFALPDFDQWVLGGRPRDQIERGLTSLLALQIDSVARACELSGAQRQKLQLAGDGDLRRLFRKIEEVRDKFRDIGQDQQKYNTAINEGSMLQMKLQSGIYDDSSLYQKVLRQTLNREQSDRLEQQERQRRKFRYEAKIELVLTQLESSILLRAEQRQRLVKILVEETEPPKKFGQYDYNLILFQAAKLGEAKLKPILDDAQWQSLKRMLDQNRGMEMFLRQQGFLP